jgi:hypothetical protein
MFIKERKKPKELVMESVNALIAKKRIKESFDKGYKKGFLHGILVSAIICFMYWAGYQLVY